MAKKVEWRCTKDRAGAWSCLGYRGNKRTLVSMFTDGMINISGKKIKCDKAHILSSEVLVCSTEISKR